MKKTKRFELVLTQEQVKILEARTISSGFISKADYIRYMLFMKKPIQEQLEELIDVLKKKSA